MQRSIIIMHCVRVTFTSIHIHQSSFVYLKIKRGEKERIASIRHASERSDSFSSYRLHFICFAFEKPSRVTNSVGISIATDVTC